MLKYRIISSVLIILGLLAAAIWMPALGLLAIVATIAMLAAAEFTGLTIAAGLPQCRYLGISGSTCLILVTGWGLLTKGSGWASELEAFVLLVVVVCTCLIVMFRDVERPLLAVSTTMATILYAPFLLNFVTKLLFGLGGDGRYLVLYMILVVKSTDIGAFFIGSAIGRHKVFPRISPAKTWEGSLGGVIVATVLSTVTGLITGGDFGVIHLSLAHSVLLGILLSVTGVFGDLIESMFKRSAQIKDSGTWIRGMGGILDVIDSLILAAPILYLYCRFMKT